MSTELIGIFGVGVALAVLIWRVSVKLDDKIGGLETKLDAKITSLTGSHNQLAREFSELRGAINTRFSMQDKKQFQEVVNHVAQVVLKGTKP